MKGHTNNPNGRPKGIPNKTTQQRRDTIAKIVDAVLEDSETLIEAIKAIPDIGKKLDALKGLLIYIQPKPADEQPEPDPQKDARSVFEQINEIIQRDIARNNPPKLLQ